MYLVLEDFFSINTVGISNCEVTFLIIRSTIVVLVVLPLSDVCYVSSHLIRNGRSPACKNIIFSAWSGSLKSRSIGTRSSFVNLIGKNCFVVNAINISYRVFSYKAYFYSVRRFYSLEFI